MKKILLALFVIIAFDSSVVYAQITDTLCFGFYNLENLFDTIDDPQKEDEEFLPGGSNAWTQERLTQKFINIARVIRSMNDFKGPDVLGMCEVEHQSLLDTLTEVYLYDKFYKVAYIESPDNRGIDNGLIYNADKFMLISVSADTIHLSDGYPTRQVVKVTLELRKKFRDLDNRITFFINHWPSRRGSETESEKNRVDAALTLKKGVDAVVSENPNARIIIIGDFNDEPDNNSLKTLCAVPFKCTDTETIKNSTDGLYNAAYPLFQNGEGSYKYKDDWNMLDQMIISKPFLLDESFSYVCESFRIYKPDFIVTKTGKYAGTSIPTYGGKTYLGGYSDHFPVNAKFVIKH